MTMGLMLVWDIRCSDNCWLQSEIGPQKLTAGWKGGRKEGKKEGRKEEQAILSKYILTSHGDY